MITIIEDAVDALTCDFLVKNIVRTSRWNVGSNSDGNFLSSNYGHILKSFDEGTIDYYDKDFVKINAIAESIIDRIFAFALSDKNDTYTIRRIYWNHYNQGGCVPSHRDTFSWNDWGDNLKSFLLHLNDSDAKNIIGGEKIDTKKGRLIVFDSNILHESTSPSTPHRYTMNAVISV